VRDHRGTIRGACGQGRALILDGLALIDHSPLVLLGSFPLDMIAALRYKKNTQDVIDSRVERVGSR
jgi:hypothetical protein